MLKLFPEDFMEQAFDGYQFFFAEHQGKCP
jgi:hypothetical protein